MLKTSEYTTTIYIYIYIYTHTQDTAPQTTTREQQVTATTTRRLREITALFVIKYTVVSLFFYSRLCFFAPLFSFDNKKWLDDDMCPFGGIFCIKTVSSRAATSRHLSAVFTPSLHLHSLLCVFSLSALTPHHPSLDVLDTAAITLV